YSDLQSALTTATAGDEIWVAAGVYTPGNTITDSFQLVDNVLILGGFDGSETARSERDWRTNQTVLSGDIDGNDAVGSSGILTDTANITGTNSYHVVTGSGTSATAVLDGFTVTAGQATGNSPNNRGGGMVNLTGSPTLTNVYFSGNIASGGGGMFNNSQSSPALTNVSFGYNAATFDAGGMFNNDQSSPTLFNVIFHMNTAANGGGMFNFADSNPVLTNVTFYGNSAVGTNARGGALLNTFSNPTLVNSIIWGNTAPTGANVLNNSSTPAYSYSIVEGSGGNTSWNSTFGTDGGNNADSDPLLDSNLHLQTGSPAIDAGNTAAYTSMIGIDLAGNVRVQNAIIDMGAFESPAVSNANSNYLPVILGGGEAGSETATPVPTETPSPSETETPTPTPTQTVTPEELRPGTNLILFNQMIEGEMVERKVYIQMPQSFVSGRSSESYPIVMALHGAGGTGFGFVNNTHLKTLIDAGEFVGVYPNGHANDGSNGGYWNLGNEATTADDPEFINMIVQYLSNYDELDTTKMYGIGYSNGSGFMNLLGKTTTYFSAIATLASQQSVSTSELTPQRTLSVFQFNGDADTLIPINGGDSVVGEFVSAEASALNWVNHFNCSTTPVKEDKLWDTTTGQSFTYSDCDDGHVVKYHVANGVSHSGLVGDEANSQFYNEIWAFFKQH
ncbi:MAG: choice-of-anchor Q domain-containing protein, partial [Chloroflexota bacterium]